MNHYPNQEKVKKIKYIVCDLDGTLYTSSAKISQATIQKLIQLQANGYTLIIATGRYYYEVKELVEKLKLAIFGGYIACCNGAEVHDCKNKRVTSFSKLSRNELVLLIKMAKQNQVSTYVNYDEHYEFIPCALHHKLVNLSKLVLYPAKCMLSDTHKISRLYRARIRTHLNKNISELAKICFLGTNQKLMQFQKHVTNLPLPYAYYPSGNMALEITKDDVGKHYAVQSIVNKKQHTLDNVLFFGDSGNDEPLLKIAGIGVAMKNADAPCLEATPYISEYTNKEDGVLRYLDSLSL